MIKIKDKQIIINGKPTIIMSGEVHYFRLNKCDWEDRIIKTKKSGCNTIATYVPWMWHEWTEGQIDLTGKTNEMLDLVGFLDLCQKHDMYIFLRPGPFIMAEVKNEGIPYWVFKKHPDAIPITWEDKKGSNITVDYLNEGYLSECKKWYKAICEITAPRLIQNGGKIIGFQLDNEIGMLAWVSNNPELNDNVLDYFVTWLKEKYGATLTGRYNFNFDDKNERNKNFRYPKEEFAAELRNDLGYFNRDRFGKYVDTLRAYAEEYGVKDIPFVINIHGTGAGRGFTFPIGISQLLNTYPTSDKYISGTDIYFGNLNRTCFQDLYIINAFTDATNSKNQPLTSVEFDCSTGDYGDHMSGDKKVSDADIKMRMYMAQGGKLINYYLMTGGFNHPLPNFPNGVSDGNDRIAFTGERHGFAAPINPLGEYSYIFDRMQDGIQTVANQTEKLATMFEERDKISFAFIPDYYMTENFYPNSEKMKTIVRNLEKNRGGSSWENTARMMLYLGFRFGSVDIQNKNIDNSKLDVLVVPSAKYMAKDIQEKIVEFMKNGGKVLFHGEMPELDMEGNPCKIILSELNVEALEPRYDRHLYYLSVYTDSYLKDCRETRSFYVQEYKFLDNNSIALLRSKDKHEVCGFERKVGAGKFAIISSQCAGNIEFFRRIFESLSLKPTLTHNYREAGIFMTSTKNSDNEKYIHIINLDDCVKTFEIFENNQKLLNINLGEGRGLMLPINMNLNNGVVVEKSSAEIFSYTNDEIIFKVGPIEEEIYLTTNKNLTFSKEVEVVKTNNQYILKIKNTGKNKLTIKLS